jgi:DNA-directed RNA polymerase specialized sigma24 family protein
MTGPEVAEALDVPTGTAYSRLRAARLTFQEAVAPASDELAPARQGAAR